jgi:uncharacterized membrane protein
MILCIPFLRFRVWNVIPAVCFMLLGFFMQTVSGPEWLMFLGIYPAALYPRDFFPLFPWLGVMLLGVAIGFLIYPKGIRSYTIREPGAAGNFLARIGKHPLEIYLLHIPVIFAALWLVMVLSHLAGMPWGYL